ncbi:MAG: type II toxin-antitoxin system VapC family toxin [Desulfuromonadaceae bacterium]|nr:type II toxin-antitoxin system VapC family toxin [Desulfuromonadaceae bacterium]
MQQILIDTNFYVAFKRKQESVLTRFRQAEYIGVSTVVLGELLAGFRCGSREAENRRELDQFLDSPRVKVLAIDEETAEFYAEIFRALREKGRPIPSNDLWIAATSLRHGLALATLDEHFRSIDSLLLVENQ